MIQKIRAHGFFLLTFGTLYLAFLHPLITLQKGFVLGDYEVQFYPWSAAYAEALRQGRLLLWTPLIQCGFPLFAEGQTGMLYALNLLLFKFLPFKQAYNFMFLLHFFLGGFFTYLFSLRLKISKEGAALAAVVFTFGSAYAGCFYNIVTLRALVWFPLALFLVELYFEKRKAWALYALALALGQSWLAGFPQMTAYAVFFLALYYFLKRLPLWPFLGALGLSVVIGLPQLWATWDLASNSTRTMQDPRFALWGSVSPFSLAAVFFYSWGLFLRISLYIGIFPFLLIISTFQKNLFRIFWGLLGASVFLAMGSFNPLYWLMIKLPGFSLLRNPGKFLFFTAFFLSVLAGFSWDSLTARLRSGQTPQESALLRRSLKTVAVFFLMACAAWTAVWHGSGFLLKFGRWYVEHFVLNLSFHRYSPGSYFQSLASYVNRAQIEINFSNFFFWAPFLFAFSWAALLYLVLSQKIKWPVFKGAFFLLLLLDLYLYGAFSYGQGFIGNVDRFPQTAAYEAYPKDGRWLDTRNLVFPPNRNLLSGHKIVGAYAPLLDKNYYLLMKGSGTLDDGFGRLKTPLDFYTHSRPLIDFLGIKYLVSSDGRAFYENPQAAPEFTWAGETQHAIITPLENREERAVIEIKNTEPGILVRNQVYDPGWKALVSGKKGELLKVNSAFQGVRLTAGKHRVEFHYRPDFFVIGRWFCLGGLLLALAGMITPFIFSRRRLLR